MDELPADHGLTYGETPVIEPIIPEQPLPPAPAPQPIMQPNRAHGSFGATVGMVALFIVLFAVGVGLSVLLRQYFASREELPSQPATIQPTPSISSLLSPTSSPTVAIVDPYSGWKTYQVMSGSTKQPVPGVNFMLPSEMLSLICDGVSCASQGTYLPNGSRFTVAPRGKGQLLVDARGNVVISDSGGKAFITKAVTLTGGKKALEYSGLFSGTTVGGYTFSQMRGLMIEIDEDETIEMNHFTPSGVSAEFAKDDVIFDKIVASLSVNRLPEASLTPTIFSTPSAIGR